MAAVGALTRVALADGLGGEEEGVGVRHDEVSAGGWVGGRRWEMGVVRVGQYVSEVTTCAKGAMAAQCTPTGLGDDWNVTGRHRAEPQSGRMDDRGSDAVGMSAAAQRQGLPAKMEELTGQKSEDAVPVFSSKVRTAAAPTQWTAAFYRLYFTSAVGPKQYAAPTVHRYCSQIPVMARKTLPSHPRTQGRSDVRSEGLQKLKGNDSSVGL